jgi:hypothetical protein
MIVCMADESSRVSLAEPRGVVGALLCHLEASVAGDAVALDGDYFWSIPADELYDLAEKPGELTIGQLSESWQHLRDLPADRDRAVGYHLVWLADVLRAIGQTPPVDATANGCRVGIGR